MNLRKFSAALLLSLSCGVAHACVCGPPETKEDIQQWIEDRKAAAAHVLLARITEVISSGRKPDLDVRVKVESLEDVKGNARFGTLSIALCQNFALMKEDIRVLFVTAEGMILPCSDYRPFINEEELLRKLRSKHR